MASIVGAQYCAPYLVELTVCKKALSLSRASFDITDAEGKVVFKMDGHAFSIKDKMVLLDPHGQPILCAKKKLRSVFHDHWEVFRGEHGDEGSKLFDVKKSKVIQVKTNLDVLLPGNTNEDCPDFQVKGDYFERSATVLHGERVISEVKRKFTAGNVVLDKHTFVVEIHPQVDQAFIVTLIIIMDAIHED